MWWFILGLLLGLALGVFAVMVVQVAQTMQACDPPTLGGYASTEEQPWQ